MILMAVALHAGAWGRVNHQAIGYIAEQHLTPKAYNTLKSYLHGECISYYAANVDEFRKTEFAGVPHTFGSDKSLKPKCKADQDATYYILQSIDALSDYKNLDDSVRLHHIKLIIHLVGDIHCPVHVGYADNRDHKHGKFKVYDYKGGVVKKFHTYIDGTLTSNKYPGGFLDVAYFADPMLRQRPSKTDKAYMAEIQQGDVMDWAADILAQSSKIFDIVQPEHHFTTEEQVEVARICKDQILRAGYRLAAVLNKIFG